MEKLAISETECENEKYSSSDCQNSLFFVLFPFVQLFIYFICFPWPPKTKSRSTSLHIIVGQ